MAREAEGLQSVEDVIHTTHETSEQKEELRMWEVFFNERRARH